MQLERGRMLLQRRLQLHGPSRPVLPVRPRRMWSLNQLISTSMMLEIKSRCGLRYLTMHQNPGVVS